MYKVRRIYGVL